MNEARAALLKGAIKSAVSSACALILALPLTDPMHFNLSSVGGWKHIGAAVLVVVVVGEARFWKQWADSGNSAEETRGKA
jgi:steroid 5-alpha reductase family enzyme